MLRRGAPARLRHPRSAAARLAEAERLYRDFEQLTPYPKPKPFTKIFDTLADHERWRRAQRNPGADVQVFSARWRPRSSSEELVRAPTR